MLTIENKDDSLKKKILEPEQTISLSYEAQLNLVECLTETPSISEEMKSLRSRPRLIVRE